MNTQPFFSSRKSTSTHANRQNVLDLEAPKMNTISYTHKLKMALVMLAFVLLGTLATSLPAHAKASDLAIVPAPCLNKCMRVTSITLDRNDPVGLPKITAIVTVQRNDSTIDISNPFVSGAQVFAIWRLPSGITFPVVGTTNGQGQAVFQINDTPGTFTFTIAKVVKTGLTFDRLNSVLSAITR